MWAARILAGLVCAGSLAWAAADPEPPVLAWKEVGGTRIPVPPAEHPRLFLRGKDVPDLAARLRHPVFQPVIERLQSLAKRHAFAKIEWQALELLLNPDAAAARNLAADALSFLTRTQLADRQDACRETGRAMVTGAIVYDWFHALLSPQDQDAYRRELIRLAKTLECGYPPIGGGSVTGHASEAMIMRDLLSAGIALYDEYPEMYELAAGRFFREHLPARNWLYAGGAYHQGDSYGPYRFGWDTFPLWIFARLGAGNVYHPLQAQVPYYYLYATRPDGQRLRGGDTYCSSTARGEPWPIGPGSLLAGSYYGDGHILSNFLVHGGLRDGEVLFDLLWRNPDLKPLPPEDLPYSRYFGSPFGWTIARTGWGTEAVIAEMKINEYNFCNHQHLDAGAFQIYHKGALAIDSGLYSGSSGQYGSPHCKNYAWRTVAHNCLLIRDPAEKFGRDDSYGNDGGQRLPNNRSEPRNLDYLRDPKNGYKTGEVLAHGCGPDPSRPEYTWLQGDITAAYSPKVKQVTRSFVFLDLKDPKLPAALVVFDRVVAADPSFPKTWLLHTLEEPRIEGLTAVVDRTADGATGRLHLTELLPAEVTKIGGPGKEFWAAGKNWQNDPRSSSGNSSMESGTWRIEITPTKPAIEDQFLTVMQTFDRTEGAAAPVSRVDADAWLGAYLAAPSGARLVMFRRDFTPRADALRFTAPGTSRVKCLVMDLEPGTWRASQAATGSELTLAVGPASRAAYFEGSPGEWNLRRSP